MTDRSKRQRRTEKGALTLHLLMIALLLLPQPAIPATITVDGQTGDAPGTSCDLVEAIENAEADSQVNADCAAGSGNDDIVLTVDVTLTDRVSGNPSAGTGLPDITGANGTITVEGGNHTIARDAGATDKFRHFRIGIGGDLTLNEVTLTGGLINSANSDSRGGAILNSGGTLTITNSTISGNTVLGTELTYTYAYGGGIYNNGTTTISNSTISGNTAEANNVAANRSIAGGAGISNGTYFSGMNPSLTLSYSTVSGNTANSIGNNSAIVYTAGLYAAQGSVSITNSTLSGNVAYASGDAASVDSGAIEVTGAATLLYNSTISSNSISAMGTISYDIGPAGIDYFSFGGSLELNETILGNHPGLDNCGGVAAGQDGGNNLADDTSCGTIPDTLTNLDSVLMDNGGLTETHALLGGSSAIDAGGVCGLPTDQRGEPRSDGLCDSGSYELGACMAANGDTFTIPDMTVISIETTFETCTSITLADVDVVGPDGHLILRTAGRVEINDGFEVDSVDARLTVEIDSGIVMSQGG